MDITIREVTEEDAEAIAAIYRPYVEETGITFEFTPPDAEEFRRRIRATKKAYPYLAACENGRIIGYAYAGRFGERKAYDWSVELSIYMDRKEKGKGAGRMLYEALEKDLKKMGIINLYSAIACPSGEPDDFIDYGSRDFHKHLGFAETAHFRKSGFKNGRWIDLIWMEKIIGNKDGTPEAVRPWPDVK
ncbi:MAG TPA: GNAT family N-acetyltransferase [Veillonellaceae bacterium]|nr:GNAT family N-acetyltransferase [Veillonellaceae bacterium]